VSEGRAPGPSVVETRHRRPLVLSLCDHYDLVRSNGPMSFDLTTAFRCAARGLDLRLLGWYGQQRKTDKAQMVVQ
jgi:hypothetical protein